jgi:hypothetical protein
MTGQLTWAVLTKDFICMRVAASVTNLCENRTVFG